MMNGNAGIPFLVPPLAKASAANVRLASVTASATSKAPMSNQRGPAAGGRTVANEVITRYEVSNAAGTLIAGATPRTTAITIPRTAVVSIVQTNTIPALRCSGAPFVAESATYPDRTTRVPARMWTRYVMRTVDAPRTAW